MTECFSWHIRISFHSLDGCTLEEGKVVWVMRCLEYVTLRQLWRAVDDEIGCRPHVGLKSHHSQSPNQKRWLRIKQTAPLPAKIIANNLLSGYLPKMQGPWLWKRDEVTYFSTEKYEIEAPKSVSTQSQ